MVSLADTAFYTFGIAPREGSGEIPFGLRLSNKYDGIAQAIGLTKATSEADAVGVKLSPTQAVKSGLMISLRINYRFPSGKRGASSIVIPRDKVVQAMEQVSGKKWGEATITSIRPRTRVDYR